MYSRKINSYIIKFGDITIEKHKFHYFKNPILIYDVDLSNILTILGFQSEKVINTLLVEKMMKNLNPLCIILLKMRSMLNSVDIVPSWVSWVSGYYNITTWWVPTFFLWLFLGSIISSRVYNLGPRFFFVGISWVQNFFSLIFCG